MAITRLVPSHGPGGSNYQASMNSDVSAGGNDVASTTLENDVISTREDDSSIVDSVLPNNVESPTTSNVTAENQSTFTNSDTRTENGETGVMGENTVASNVTFPDSNEVHKDIGTVPTTPPNAIHTGNDPSNGQSAVDGPYNYNRIKVFHDDMGDDIEKKLIATIEQHLIYGTAKSEKEYMSMPQLHDQMRKHFLHLEQKIDNIFLVNSPTQCDWFDFYLNQSSLLRLMLEKVIVDVQLMTFLVNCLNGPLYRKSMRHRDQILTNNKNDDDPAYHLQIGQPNDYSDINITAKPENSELINCFDKNKKAKVSIYRDVLKKWNETIIPDFAVDRKYKAIAHTMVQDHDDAENIQSYDNTWCKFILPTYDDKKWRLINVEMPNNKLNGNGMVELIDHFPRRGKSGYQPHISATMWYAKYFGLVYNSCYFREDERILKYTADMMIDKFESCKLRNTTLFLSTSLDHSGHLARKKYSNEIEKYNSGVATVLEIIYRCQCLFSKRPKKPLVFATAQTENELVLLICNLVFAMFKIICPENKYIYEPEENDCGDDADSWKEVADEAKGGEGVQKEWLWGLMREKLKIIVSKRPHGVGGKVNLHNHYDTQVFQNGIEKEDLTLFMPTSQLAKAVGIKLSAINNDTDLKQQLLDFVVGRLIVKKDTRTKPTSARHIELLREDVSKRLLDSTTYFLIDAKEKAYCMRNDFDIEEYEENDDGTRVKIRHDTDLYGVLIIEKDVCIDTKSDCIIHYLCVKEGNEGFGYATKMLNTAFKDEEIADKRVHCVLRLSNPFKWRAESSLLPQRSTCYRQFYLSNKSIKEVVNLDCSGLVFPGAFMAVTNGKTFRNMECKDDATVKSCAVYAIDSFTRTAIVLTDGVTGGSKNTYYTKSTHFGWMRESPQNVCNNYPRDKIKLAKENREHIVYFRDGGRRRKVHDNAPVKLKDHRIISCTSAFTALPLEYYQIHYPKFENGCIWLATCQIMFTLNTDLASRMINEYQKDPTKYEYIRLFKCNRPSAISLAEKIDSIHGCEYRIEHVKCTANNTLTDYVLNIRTSGYFVAIIRDGYGGRTHAIGIDVAKRVVYDSMEKLKLKLNSDTLNKCCGQDRSFTKFEIVAELKLYRKEKYRNTKKRKIVAAPMRREQAGHDVDNAIIIDDSDGDSS